MYTDEIQAFVNSTNHKSYSYTDQNMLFSCIFKCHEAHITKIFSFINTINGIRDEKLETRDSVIIPLWLFNKPIRTALWRMSGRLGGPIPWDGAFSM